MKETEDWLEKVEKETMMGRGKGLEGQEEDSLPRQRSDIKGPVRQKRPSPG